MQVAPTPMHLLSLMQEMTLNMEQAFVQSHLFVVSAALFEADSLCISNMSAGRQRDRDGY